MAIRVSCRGAGQPKTGAGRAVEAQEMTRLTGECADRVTRLSKAAQAVHIRTAAAAWRNQEQRERAELRAAVCVSAACGVSDANCYCPHLGSPEGVVAGVEPVHIRSLAAQAGGVQQLLQACTK